MNVRTTSGLLVTLLTVCAASGLLSLISNTVLGEELMLVHRASGVALLLLIPWKSRIIARSWRQRIRRGTRVRRGLDFSLGVSSLGLGLFLASVCLGLAWAFALLPNWIAGFGPLLLHWWLGIAVLPLLLWHLLARWPRPTVGDFRGRRRLLSALGGAALAFAGGVSLQRLADFARNGEHRWSGSRHVGDFTGNALPVTIFLADTTPQVDINEWRLRIHGPTPQPQQFSFARLVALGGSAATATLDCTSGWYSTQAWGGVALASVLREAGVSGTPTVLVRSITGHFTILTPDEVSTCLLATHLGGEPLSPEHGFPLRLVAPARRGWQWIKWVDSLEIL